MTKSLPVVISLGGSMLFDDAGVNVDYLKKFASLIERKTAEGKKIAVVVGGGRIAGIYASAGRDLTGVEFYGDKMAIEITRVNARLLITALGGAAFPKVIRDFDDAVQAFSLGLIPVGAGLLEGVTTDTIATVIAERLHASHIINVSNVDYVYDSDPKFNPNAKKLESMTHSELANLTHQTDTRKARANIVFDSVAAKLAARSGKPIYFVGGRKLEEIEKAIDGKPIQGTIVSTK